MIRKLLTVAALVVAGSANASLIGTTVSCSALAECYDGTTAAIITSATVADPFVEFNIMSSGLRVDVNDSSITFANTGNNFYGPGWFVDVGGLDTIIGITSIDFSGIGGNGPTASNFTFSNGHLVFDFGDVSLSRSSVITVNLTSDLPAVPEPGGLTLGAVALACLGFARRQRR